MYATTVTRAWDLLLGDSLRGRPLDHLAKMIGTGLDGFGPLCRSARAVQRLLEVLLAFLGQ